MTVEELLLRPENEAPAAAWKSLKGTSPATAAVRRDLLSLMRGRTRRAYEDARSRLSKDAGS